MFIRSVTIWSGWCRNFILFWCSSWFRWWIVIFKLLGMRTMSVWSPILWNFVSSSWFFRRNFWNKLTFIFMIDMSICFWRGRWLYRSFDNILNLVYFFGILCICFYILGSFVSGRLFAIIRSMIRSRQWKNFMRLIWLNGFILWGSLQTSWIRITEFLSSNWLLFSRGHRLLIAWSLW